MDEWISRSRFLCMFMSWSPLPVEFMSSSPMYML
uniref:Uncharacterized protein n=1 Tax=Arundo donax TaxID=35708 RepID=A0A0A8YRT3_ARUDO